MTEIINLVAMLTIFGAGSAAGILLTIQFGRHRRAELQADRDRFAEERLSTPERVRVGSRGGLGPSGVDPRDSLPI
jgi:hypothetical protein